MFITAYTGTDFYSKKEFDCCLFHSNYIIYVLERDLSLNFTKQCSPKISIGKIALLFLNTINESRNKYILKTCPSNKKTKSNFSENSNFWVWSEFNRAQMCYFKQTFKDNYTT